MLIGDDRDRAGIAVVGRVELDAVESAGFQRGQGRNEAHAEAGANQLERHVVGAAMGDDAMRRQDALVPLLDTQRMLRTEIELDGAVEHARGAFRRALQLLYGGTPPPFSAPHPPKTPP